MHYFPCDEMATSATETTSAAGVPVSIDAVQGLTWVCGPRVCGLAVSWAVDSPLGVPLPLILAPLGDAVESEDDAGRFRFDVTVRLPLGLGRVVQYRGWLVPG